MDYFSKLSRQITYYVLLAIFLVASLTATVWFLAINYFGLNNAIASILAGCFSIVLLLIAVRALVKFVTAPIRILSQAILHVTPGQHNEVAPNLDKVRLGRELVTSLSLQVYQLASVSGPAISGEVVHNEPNQQAKAILDGLPVPILVANKAQTIIYANQIAAAYLNLALADIVGKSIYSIVDLSFSSEDTLDAWLSGVRQNTVTASHNWDRVRIMLSDQKTKKQCDIAAYYNKNNPAGVETILTLFDKTQYYRQDDDAIGFIALAVHELRTPLTILRGYIEVFEDELQGQLNPEMEGYMQKMKASAQQLTSFISNILNVARVEENQLFLQLHEEKWDEVLRYVAADMELMAKVHGKKITYNIEPNLPTVAVDRVSIYEVVNNLLDNAIKYSDKSDKIIVTAHKRDDGMVETTVQDFGIGVPSSIIGNLFEKFYRNHRSRAQFGGTGLGLYLSKAIVSAHGGQIWIQSKEGEGSTLGFTLQPYSELAKKTGGNNNKDIVRTAHGWIKNHSFYRK